MVKSSRPCRRAQSARSVPLAGHLIPVQWMLGNCLQGSQNSEVQCLRHQNIKAWRGTVSVSGNKFLPVRQDARHLEQPKRANRSPDNSLQEYVCPRRFLAFRALAEGSLHFHKCTGNSSLTHLQAG